MAAFILLQAGLYARPPPHSVDPAVVLETVAQKTIGRLTRAFRKLRGPSNTCALDLPPEIILMIVGYLDELAIICLALTCKSFHGLWERGSLPMLSTEKEMLLLLLEKDIPFLYYCHQCTKLHHWHGRSNRSVIPRYSKDLPYKCRDNRLHFSYNCSLPYYYARLAMNRHFYGPKHGISLRVFKERIQSCYHFDGVVRLECQDARIVNDRLLIKSAVSMWHRRGDPIPLRDYVERYGNSVCEHLVIWQGCPGYIPAQLPELARKGDSPGQFSTCAPTLGSCTLCPTDYSIEIRWQGVRKGYNIEVIVYRGLDDCRTPFSWHWRSSTTPRTTDGLRSTYSPELTPGSIRDEWIKAGGNAEVIDSRCSQLARSFFMDL